MDDATDHPRGEDEPVVEVDLGEATVTERLLELLSDLPSTPHEIALEARERASVIAQQLPPRPGRTPVQTPLRLPRHELVGIAGLLELLAEMPSTPPSVAEEARGHVEALWAQVGHTD